MRISINEAARLVTTILSVGESLHKTIPNTKKEPIHLSMIARKRSVISVFICIDLNIIQTLPSCFWDLKSLDRKPWLCLGFLSRSLNPLNTPYLICIIYVTKSDHSLTFILQEFYSGKLLCNIQYHATFMFYNILESIKVK